MQELETQTSINNEVCYATDKSVTKPYVQRDELEKCGATEEQNEDCRTGHKYSKIQGIDYFLVKGGGGAHEKIQVNEVYFGHWVVESVCFVAFC